jgi:hypothetical protein
MDKTLIETPFDQYQRYITIKRCVDIIKDSYGLSVAKVLDVGGGTGVIRQFLTAEDTTIVDMEESDLPGYVRASGADLPFEDDAFDAVVSADVLEHVPAEARQKFLSEAMRVTKDIFILIAPFNHKLTPDFEKILYEFVLSATGNKHQFLKEHIDNGLPDSGVVDDFVEKSGMSAVCFPSGYLYNWLVMMMARSRFEGLPDSAGLIAEVETTYNKNFSEGDYRAPAYRTVYIISKKKSDLPNTLVSSFKVEAPAKEEETREMARLVEMVYKLYKTDTENKTKEMDHTIEVMTAEQDRLNAEIAELAAVVGNREEQIANLQGWIDEIHNKAVYKAYKGIRKVLPGGRD